VNTKGFDKRSTAEPENERVLSGPREGFTECFMPNLALIRRRVNDPRLKFRFMRVGSRTNTNVCLCYIAGLCENSLVERLETRLTALDIDSVLDSNYLAERIRDHRWSPFPTLGTTERPDVAASRMLEGRCVIVVDGSPVALTAPFLFQECFQSNDDYYISFLQANLSRILRVIGLYSRSRFAMYAALMLYHRELVPARLLFVVSAAQRGVPFPSAGDFAHAVRTRHSRKPERERQCHGTDDGYRRSGAR
ncbi:MAG: spore germination protein, partial [Butyricicoccus sp.]